MIDLPTHEIRRMHVQVAQVSADHLNQLFDLLFREEPVIKFSSQTKIALEMVSFKLLQAKPALSIETLINQLDALRNELTDTTEGQSVPPVDKQNPPATAGSSDLTGPGNDAPRAEVAPTESSISRCFSTFEERVPNKSIISANHPSLAANLTKCQLRQVDEDHLVIEVAGNGFNLSMIQKSKNLEIIHRVCKEVFGKVMEIDVHAGSASTADTIKKKKEDNKIKSEALSHPLVAEALEIFDGKLIDVRILKEDA